VGVGCEGSGRREGDAGQPGGSNACAIKSNIKPRNEMNNISKSEQKDSGDVGIDGIIGRMRESVLMVMPCWVRLVCACVRVGRQCRVSVWCGDTIQYGTGINVDWITYGGARGVKHSSVVRKSIASAKHRENAGEE
jgi:hypothetical protein